MLLRDGSPISPARAAEIERFEIENEHLRHQISLLQYELENRRHAFLAVHEINAANEARARNAEARLEYLKQSNKELAVQVEKLTKRSHRDQTKAATAERAAAQLEAQNLWLEAQLKAALYENTKIMQQNQQHGPQTVFFRATTSAPPQMQTESTQTKAAANGIGNPIGNTKSENLDPVVVLSAGNSLSLSLSLSEASSSLAAAQQQQQHNQRNEECNGNGNHLNDHDDTQLYNDTINNQFSFPIISSLPLSPPRSMPPPMNQQQQQAQPWQENSIDKDQHVRPNTYAEAITRSNSNSINRITNNNVGRITSGPSITTKKRITTAIGTTYGNNPRFVEIRKAYHNVLTSQAAEEEPLARWVRTVMSNTSAIETDPKKVEPVLLGLKALCEENGISLSLQKVGPCQFQLGGGSGSGGSSGGRRLSVRLINGRLMARSGPAWIDIFKWLEKQPCHEEGGVAL